ncbi:MAG: carboxypeptidase-like regulatory domain-containing protein [Pseudomonadota bacterium]
MRYSGGTTRRAWIALALAWVAAVAACAEDPAPGEELCAVEEPVTERAQQGLVVGGCQCQGWQPGVTCAQLSYADIPADDTYYVTTFGGPGDGQDMWICGYKSTANGTWAYMAGYERFGCGKVLIKHPSQNKYCVAEVADCGPNKCVEQAACTCGCGGHVPIVDVSPFITNHLFGITSSGWSEKREVLAWQVAASEPIGCFNGSVGPGTGILKGVVYVAPDTADRIPGATVTLNTSQSAVANGVGYWEFELAPGTYTATATKAGYLTASQTRSVSAGAEVWGSIGLSPCACGDGNPCTEDACTGGQCVHTNNAKSCDDGNACTTGDHCAGGQCNSGASLACGDGNPCTNDSCQPASGCLHAPNVLPCDDGNACTTGDHCAGGQCAGGPPLTCEDGNPCTDDACTIPAGCAFTPNSLPCDDGNACTVGDHCVGGSCAGGQGLSCDDGNPCTDDACAGNSGCVHTANTVPCDDGDACTGGDVCVAGLCAGLDISIACGDGNPCTDDLCAPATGCLHLPNALPCDDGDACTTGGCVRSGDLRGDRCGGL